jgi:PAS domain S-box-containing protein
MTNAHELHHPTSPNWIERVLTVHMTVACVMLGVYTIAWWIASTPQTLLLGLISVCYCGVALAGIILVRQGRERDAALLSGAALLVAAVAAVIIMPSNVSGAMLVSVHGAMLAMPYLKGRSRLGAVALAVLTIVLMLVVWVLNEISIGRSQVEIALAMCNNLVAAALVLWGLARWQAHSAALLARALAQNAELRAAHDAMANHRIGSATEITERRRAEAALRRREAQLRAVLDSLPYEFWMRDAAGRVVMQSARSRQLWGDGTGNTVDEANVSSEVRTLWRSRNQRAVAGEVVRDETRRQIDGRERIYDDTIAPVREGELAGSIVGLMVDITERKQAETALAQHTRAQTALASCLQTLLLPNHDERARRKTLGAIAELLRGGLLAAQVTVLIRANEGQPDALELLASTEQQPDLKRLWNLRDLLTIAEDAPAAGSGLQLLPAGAIADASGRTQAYPITIEAQVWGAIICSYAEPHLAESPTAWLTRRVAEMLALTVRRWLAVDALQRNQEIINSLNADLERRVIERTAALEATNTRLHESEANNRALLLAIPDTILRIGYDGIVRAVKPSRDPSGLLTFPSGVGRRVDALLPPQIADHLLAHMANSEHAEGLQTVEIELPQRLGEYLAGSGAVPSQEIEAALDQQAVERERGESRPLGTLLVERGVIPPALVEAALRQQQRAAALRVYELRVLPSEAGEILVMIRDVTTRHHAEESVRFRGLLLDAVQQAVAATDNDGRVVYWNHFAEQLYGWAAGEAEGVLLTDLVLAPESRFAAHDLAWLSTTSGWSGEFVASHRDGVRFPAWVSVAPLHGRDGRKIGIVGTSLDISERKQTEWALRGAFDRLAALNDDLRRSRDLLRALFDSLDDGLALLGNDGTVLAANTTLASSRELTPEGCVGLGWAQVFAEAADIVERAINSGQIQRERMRITTPRGRPGLIDLRIVPLAGISGVEQVIVHSVDVTEQVQLETRVIEQERFAASGRLAATVAHEVNTPLQAIESCLHLAQRSTEVLRDRYLLLAQEELRRVGSILRQLLDLFRASIGERAPVDLNALIGRVLLLMGSTLARQGITVERQLSAGLPLVSGRSDELTQVLLNLVVNATQAMPDGGSMLISTRLHTTAAGERALALELADNGAGIAPEAQERIFEPFFTTRENGTGLGLAISQQLVAAHGGHILVSSMPGKGAAFTLLFPLPSDDDASDAAGKRDLAHAEI